MRDVEKRLRSLAVPEPSENLRKRIFGEKPALGGWKRAFALRISLVWAASAALVAGLVGYSIPHGATGMAQRAPSLEPAMIRVQIVETPATHHLFDFTETSKDFLPGSLTVRVKTNGEV
jgi:hypothetical protein